MGHPKHKWLRLYLPLALLALLKQENLTKCSEFHYLFIYFALVGFASLLFWLVSSVTQPAQGSSGAGSASDLCYVSRGKNHVLWRNKGKNCLHHGEALHLSDVGVWSRGVE